MSNVQENVDAKVRNLKDYYNRITNNIPPPPSGTDIVNTLKFFSQTLLSVLKDVPKVPHEAFAVRQKDVIRLSVFPTLNYSGLYDATLTIADIVPMVESGQLELGESVLHVLGCLVPFLEYDLLDGLPYTIAATLPVFPTELHGFTIDLLCTYLLPATLGHPGINECATTASDSMAAVLMMVFQYTQKPEYHSQLLECLMSMKKDSVKDLLQVIAYGPPACRVPAATLLFHYWPQLNPSLTDRRGMHYKYLAWQSPLCQRNNCINSRRTHAKKICMDPELAIECCGRPPPVYICVDCYDILRRDHAKHLIDTLLPMDHVSLVCENKNCSSSNSQAIVTCFSMECALTNRNRPVRYCASCHDNKHIHDNEHIYHSTILEVWSEECEQESQNYLMDAIVSLLKEAEPLEEKKMLDLAEDASDKTVEAEERKLLSRYGIWMMVELCKPSAAVPVEQLGRLLGILFHWFDCVAYLPDDNVGNALEKLKPEYIYNWLQEVKKTHYEVILTCLLPHPVEYARAGGSWDTLSSRTTQIKEGLQKLNCLGPYDIVTYEVWDYIMPYWLEAIRTEIPKTEMVEIKTLLNKTFDIEMSPLPFLLDKMYHFIDERFEDSLASVQEQALQWLQILSSVDIVIPLLMLLKMFKTGVYHLCNPPTLSCKPNTAGGMNGDISQSPLDEIQEDSVPLSSTPCPEFENELREVDLNINCFILMLDILLKQIELGNTPSNLGLHLNKSKEMLLLAHNMLIGPKDGEHTCQEELTDGEPCKYCEENIVFYQLVCRLIAYVSPKNEVKLPDRDLPRMEEIQPRSGSTESAIGGDTENDSDMTSTEEAEAEFNFEDMPAYLQLLHTLIDEMEIQKDTDILFYVMKSMKILIIHGEVLSLSLKENETYVHHLLKKKLVQSFWNMLEGYNSHLALLCVSMLLHCLTLPHGADRLWKVVEDEFLNDDWRVRFSAVEKATVLARLMEAESVKNNQIIVNSLAHIFSHYIGLLNDVNAAVAQKAHLALDSIKPASIKCMCECMAVQFDSVISDRCMILQRMYQLANCLKNLQIWSWDFFLNRFDTLSLEAQIDLESHGDITQLTDLTSSDKTSQHFLRKLNRARFALARSDSVRSVTPPLFTKPVYNRAVSVPQHLMLRNIACKDPKSKIYARQKSAPTLRRRGRSSSNLSLGMFNTYLFPEGNLREFTDQESKFAALLQKAMDLEGVERETVHLLVTLLTKFMMQVEVGCEAEDKTRDVVIRHLYVLLGYVQTEKSFIVPPYKLRSSTVFNAFLAGLPQILDRNYELGKSIFYVCLLLLQYCPSPQRYASDYQPPDYTLWYLEPHSRQSWLSAVLIILYKYQYNGEPAMSIMSTLVRLTINTINGQHHKCRLMEVGPIGPNPMLRRTRDTSNVSVGDLEKIQETPESSGSHPVTLTSQMMDNNSMSFRTDKTDFQQSLVQFRIQKLQEAAKSKETPPTKKKSNPKRPPRKLPDYSLPESESDDKSKSDVEEPQVNLQSKAPEKPKTLELSFEQYVIEKSLLESQSREVSQLDHEEKHRSLESLVSCGSPKTLAAPMNPVSEDETALIQTDGEGSHPQILLQTKNCQVGSPTSREISLLDLGTCSKRKGKMLRCNTIEEETTFSEVGRRLARSLSGDSPKMPHRILTSSPKKDPDAISQENVESLPKETLEPPVSPLKPRKTGLITVEMSTSLPNCKPEETKKPQQSRTKVKPRYRRKVDLPKTNPQTKPPPSRFSETLMVDRCSECSAILEQYEEETISLCITVLATFVHREPAQAAPLLLDMVQSVAKIASSCPYSWQTDNSNLVVPGNSISVARQFLRCTLHQLAPNGIFVQLFQSNIQDPDFFKTMACALMDFTDLSSYMALEFLLEGLNSKKNLPSDSITTLICNLATYMDCIGLDTPPAIWSGILSQFEAFFRKLPSVLPNPCDMAPVLHIMTTALKIPGIGAMKYILEPFSKLLSFTIQNCTFKLQSLLDICIWCSRGFTKDRDKLFLCRSIVFELVQALKFKTSCPDENILILIQFVVMDAGGTLCPTNITAEIPLSHNPHSQNLMSTSACECMRHHVGECLEFIADLHTLTKVKNNMKGNSLNEDTLGGQLKSGIAQYIALEFTRARQRDNRAIARFLPWLYHPPSAMQQGPKEFIDCVDHMRMLSWLLLGSLTHTAITQSQGTLICQPVPLEASNFIADHILVIMTGFAEQSKVSVLHMSSLFHAFLMCQLWTIYCESMDVSMAMTSEFALIGGWASTTIMDFWGRVTPGILQLLAHSKVLTEMVNLHLLSLMEALQECRSTVLSQLFALWSPILFSYHGQLPGHMQVRLQTCQNWEPPKCAKDETAVDANILLMWIKKLQFKLGQIEMQSSAATQFYTV